MPSAIPTASVVVINWNGKRYLDACFEALMAQEVEGGFEVILADNDSSDGSREHTSERWRDVRVLNTGGNLGFAGGNNAGIRAATGRFVVLLNNDTRVRPGWLAALVELAQREQRVGAVTSKLVYMDRPTVLQNAGSMLLSDGSGADRGSGEEDRGQYDSPEQVFAFCGGAALLNRAALADVGLLDETFFTYYEDTDLAWRMRLRGWSTWYQPAAVVEHVHAGTSVEWSPNFTFHVDRNRLFMILKNAPAGFVARTYAGFARRSLRMSARLVLRRRDRVPAAAGGAPAPNRARVHLRVAASLVAHMPEMLVKRFQVRRRRSVPDADVLAWLRPREEWDRHLEATGQKR